MSELSIFIDESGDFGEYDYHSPYYIISMVYHDQADSIEEPLQALSRQLSNIGYPDHCVHTGPIIRRENEYEYEKIMTRRKIFNYMITFIKHTDIRYKCFSIEKKHIEDSVEAVGKLSKTNTKERMDIIHTKIPSRRCFPGRRSRCSNPQSRIERRFESLRSRVVTSLVTIINEAPFLKPHMPYIHGQIRTPAFLPDEPSSYS